MGVLSVERRILLVEIKEIYPLVKGVPILDGLRTVFERTIV